MGKPTNIVKVVVRTLGTPAFKAEIHYIGGKSKVHKTLTISFDFVSELPHAVQNVINRGNYVVCGKTATFYVDDTILCYRG